MNRDTAIEYAKVLKALIELNKLSKIINTFIKAFVHNTVQKEDGFWYLFGNFNLGGTVSGRVSSSKINLQQLPSTGSEYAKAIKQCFKAPPGYILVGADFSSLEDRISALTTKDPNKLKVYMGEIVYELNLNGTCHHIRGDSIIEYDGKTYKGDEFYDKFKEHS